MNKVVGGWAEGEGEADSPLSRELMRGLIPVSRDHNLSRRQMLNHLSHPGAPQRGFDLHFQLLMMLSTFSYTY